MSAVSGIGVIGYYETSGNRAARPAFNLDSSKILFTSAAAGGKPVNVGTLSANQDFADITGNDGGYKLTLKDTRTFAVTETSANGGKGETVTFRYENATTGTTEYISAMIVDDNDEVLYYGQLENVTDSADESGTVDFKIPLDIGYGTYELKLFNEQINGNYKTDYSSDFKRVELNVLPKATIKTVPVAATLTYNGVEQELLKYAGTAIGGTVMYSPEENGTYSEAVPKGKNATNYKVWYYIKGDADHADSDKEYVEVKITQATPTASDFAFAPTKNNLTYDGNVKTATVTPKTGITGMGDITVKYYDASGTLLTSTPTDAGTYTVKIDVAVGDNYTSAIDLTASNWTYTIAQATNSFTSPLSITGWTYGETANQPTATTKFGTPTFTYATEENGTYTTTVPTDAGTYWVMATVERTANYTGIFDKKSFVIAPKTLGESNVGDIAAVTFSGNALEPTLTVTDGSTTLVSETDYDVAYAENINAGTAKATVTFKGNYTGTAEKSFTIEQATNSFTSPLFITGGTYGETANQPTATTKLGTPTFTYATEENGTYTTTVPTNAGTYWVKATVVGTENYAEVSSEPISFEIAQATPTENPDNKTTARVKRGRTLAEATVTNGEMLGVDGVSALDGTFVWVDDAKTVSGNGTEQMTFTPTNTNYAPIIVDVEVSTYSSGGGNSVTRYTVKFDTDGGSTIANLTVTKNGKATEPTEPTKDGYNFDGWYTDSKFANEYDFDTKVTKNITLYAKWVEEEAQEPSDDKKDDNKDDEQKPTTDEWKNPFADVAVDSYYANAVIWAQQNGIVSGISETEFAPDENITREQIAVILYRYAKAMEYDVTVGEDTNILSYTDFNDISEYAISAMQYAVGSGLINGKTESTLNPKDNATRAEIAAILNRFIESNK